MTSPADPSLLVLKQVAAVLGRLTAEQLRELVDGRGELVFRSGDTVVAAEPTRSRPAAAPTAELDVDGVVAAIRALDGAGEVESYLAAHDKALTVPALREVARRLGPTVVGNGRNKAEIRRNIVQGTAGFRERSAAMSGGAWG